VPASTRPSLLALLWLGCPSLLVAGAGCAPAPDAPLNPTWADVEPILRGQCNHCHGGSAATTGSVGSIVYRLDACGEAAQAMSLPALARALAPQIKTDVTPLPGAPRPRMPPAPAAVLADWERETLVRWADAPVLGAPPAGNRPPRLEVKGFPALIDQRLTFVAQLSDPDGHSAVGVLRVRDLVFRMDRPGSFQVDLDTRAWEPGPHRLTAVLCDGWQRNTYDLGQITVRR